MPCLRHKTSRCLISGKLPARGLLAEAQSSSHRCLFGLPPRPPHASPHPRPYPHPRSPQPQPEPPFSPLPPLQAAFLVVSHLGGKMLLFQGSAPSLGTGKFKAREVLANYGTEKEAGMRNPEDPFFKRRVFVSSFLRQRGWWARIRLRRRTRHLELSAHLTPVCPCGRWGWGLGPGCGGQGSSQHLAPSALFLPLPHLTSTPTLPTGCQSNFRCLLPVPPIPSHPSLPIQVFDDPQDRLVSLPDQPCPSSTPTRPPPGLQRRPAGSRLRWTCSQPPRGPSTWLLWQPSRATRAAR